jgi:hypothetical protein
MFLVAGYVVSYLSSFSDQESPVVRNYHISLYPEPPVDEFVYKFIHPIWNFFVPIYCQLFLLPFKPG